MGWKPSSWVSHVAKSIGAEANRAADLVTNQAGRTWGQVDAAATRAENGKLFGSSAWGRTASNLIGATTSARLVRRARGREVVGNGDVISDASYMRPGKGYSAGQSGPMKDALTAAAARQAADDAALLAQQQADERFARGQSEVTSRRRRRAKQASTKGGTLLTGAQGLVDTSTTGGGAGALLTGG